MNRLFEALSDIESEKPAPKRGPRTAASRAVIQLGTRADVAAPPIPARDPEAVQLPTVANLTDVLPFHAPSPVPTGQTGLFQFSTETAATDVLPFDLPAPVSPEKVDFVESSTEAPATAALALQIPSPVPPGAAESWHIPTEILPNDVFPSDVTSVILLLDAEQITTESVTPEVLPSDMASLIRLMEEELDQMAQVDLTTVSHSDVTPTLPSQQAEFDWIATESLPAEMPSSDATSPIPDQQSEFEWIATETLTTRMPSSRVTSPAPSQQEKTDQISTEATVPEVSPCEASSTGAPDVRTVAASSTLESEVVKESELKPTKPVAVRPVTVRATPESRLVALADPDCLGAEKFRALAARLEHQLKPSELKSFQVTSSVVNEGKTLVSGNVAVTLAKHFDSKTLLVEGDLHRPTLAKIFGLDKLRGLNHWWSGREQDLGQFVHKVEGLPLWFLPAGKPCDRPSDILRSARFVKAFAELASQFEWVVVDSTPMVPIVDVNLWSRLVDGTLLVAREGVTPVKALKQGLQALDHPNLLGMVLNEATASAESKYDGHYYGSPKRN